MYKVIKIVYRYVNADIRVNVYGRKDRFDNTKVSPSPLSEKEFEWTRVFELSTLIFE